MTNYVSSRNTFRNKTPEEFRFTNHFFKRWNERVEEKFENKRDLEKYIRANYSSSDMKHINGDYFMMKDLMVTCAKDRKTGNIIFITVYGTKENNPTTYNILMTEGARGIKKVHRKYGKIHLQEYK